MKFVQKNFTLKPYKRGFHLITDLIEANIPELRAIKTGMLNIFIQHTSASVTINENADPTVRGDFERYFNESVPENAPFYRHTLEGSDDMPAHLKASILGASLNIPVSNGRLNLGTWQGIYLCEHRDFATPRSFVLTLWGI
jgi:secondary thiamine-phosphate synthase enzyme